MTDVRITTIRGDGRRAACDWGAAGLGVLAVGLLAAPWYSDAGRTLSTEQSSAFGGGGIEQLLSTTTLPHRVSGWDASTLLSAALFAFSVAVLLQAAAFQRGPTALAARAWRTGIGAAAVALAVWIAVRLAWPPDGLDAAWAGWVTLAIVVTMAVAGGCAGLSQRSR